MMNSHYYVLQLNYKEHTLQPYSVGLRYTTTLLCNESLSKFA